LRRKLLFAVSFTPPREPARYRVQHGQKCPNPADSAVECKWSAGQFDPAHLMVFRRLYPHGSNMVVAQDIDQGFHREFQGIKVDFVNLRTLIELL
jgi:hypothetical protein